MKTLQSTSAGRGSAAPSRRGRGGGGRRDARFAARFTDPRFQLAQRVARGRAGRAQQRSAKERNLEAARHDARFRRLVAQDATPSDEDDENSDDDEDDEKTDEEEEEELMRRVMAEGEGSAEVDDDEDEEDAAWEPQELSYTEPHRRLAVVNCDWDHIRAVDLYAILFHALPLGGQLNEVCVYLSEFGRTMLEHERVHGPDLWSRRDDADKEANDNNDDNDDAAVQADEEDATGEFFSAGKYRAYEMNRMKYYYAIASFDSAETAATVYAALDGMDIEASGVVLDLRYVEDTEHFTNPVSRADHIPANFRPLAAFKAAALTQTRFRISWDQDDAFRHVSFQDSFTGTSAEDDLAAYLAPPDSDSDDAQDDSRDVAATRLKVRRKYAALLDEIGGGLSGTMEDTAHDPPPRLATGTDDDNIGSGSSSSDDDALNRFSDVELDSQRRADSDDDATAPDTAEWGAMEATLDMEAEDKALQLQREARLRHRSKEGTLADRAELHYKLRRKEMKRSKRAMLREERAAASAAPGDEDRARLVAALASGGADVSTTTPRLKGKERRKAHAHTVKERVARERQEKRRRRVIAGLGLAAEAEQGHVAAEAAAALRSIDTRFQDKLLSDARYHISVAQRDRRVGEDVAHLADAVVKARRGVRQGSATRQRKTGKEDAGDGMDSGVHFFLSKTKSSPSSS